MFTGFEPITEVTADSRARVTVGKAGVHSNDRFLVSTSPDGEILLTPLASVPRRELLVWENEQVRRSLLRGLYQAARGETEPLGDLLEQQEDA